MDAKPVLVIDSVIGWYDLLMFPQVFWTSFGGSYGILIDVKLDQYWRWKRAHVVHSPLDLRLKPTTFRLQVHLSNH